MPVDEKFKLQVLSMIRGIGERFEDPDDDWMPVLIVGKNVVPLDFANEDSKDFMANIVMPLLIEGSKAREYAFISSTWTATIEPPEEWKGKSTEEQMRYIQENYLPPSMSDQRKECVIVSFGCSDGTNEMWMAEIKRFGDKPPELDEWKHHGDGECDGRFIGPLMEAVKKNA